jgi:hypothetical protein
VGFSYECPGEEAGGGGEDRGHTDGGVKRGEGGGDAADQGAERISGVAPATVRVAKKLQSGRLDVYLAYMLVAVVAVLALVAASS